jgi:hypothetical protein
LTKSKGRSAKLLLQPVIQYYANAGAGTGQAVVFGFRAKVEFSNVGKPHQKRDALSLKQ